MHFRIGMCFVYLPFSSFCEDSPSELITPSVSRSPGGGKKKMLHVLACYSSLPQHRQIKRYKTGPKHHKIPIQAKFI